MWGHMSLTDVAVTVVLLITLFGYCFLLLSNT